MSEDIVQAQTDLEAALLASGLTHRAATRLRVMCRSRLEALYPDEGTSGVQIAEAGVVVLRRVAFLIGGDEAHSALSRLEDAILQRWQGRVVQA